MAPQLDVLSERHLRTTRTERTIDDYDYVKTGDNIKTAEGSLSVSPAILSSGDRRSVDRRPPDLTTLGKHSFEDHCGMLIDLIGPHPACRNISNVDWSSRESEFITSA